MRERKHAFGRSVHPESVVTDYTVNGVFRPPVRRLSMCHKAFIYKYLRNYNRIGMMT